MPSEYLPTRSFDDGSSPTVFHGGLYLLFANLAAYRGEIFKVFHAAVIGQKAGRFDYNSRVLREVSVLAYHLTVDGDRSAVGPHESANKL